MRPVKAWVWSITIALALPVIITAPAMSQETSPGDFGWSPHQIPGLNPGVMNPFGPGTGGRNPNAGLVQTFRQKGMQAYNRQDFAQASDFFRQALLLDPGNQDVRFELMEAERAKAAQVAPAASQLDPFVEDSIARQKRVRDMIDEDVAKQNAEEQPVEKQPADEPKEATPETPPASDHSKN